MIILLLLINIVNSVYLDAPCYNQPCLPNAILLNAGIDLSTGDPAKGQVLGLEWSNESFFYNNGIYYEIPNGTSVNPLSESSDTEGTFLFSDTLTIEKWQADQVTKSYLGGMFSHSTMTYQSITSEYQQIRDTGYVIKKMAVYNVIIPASRMTIGPECQSNIDLLPVEYNRDKYFQFIYSYGTHVSNYSIWGIEYSFLSNYKQCLITSTSESYTEHQCTTNAWISSEHHTTYSGSSSTDTYYQSRRLTSETFDGGAINCHSSAQWDCWWLSGMNLVDPIRISYSTIPIYTLIDDKIKSANMEQAFHEYFSMKLDQQNEVIEKNKLGPHNVAYVEYTTYSISPTSSKVVLSAGESVIINGDVCNFFHRVHVTGTYYLSSRKCERLEDGRLAAIFYIDDEVWLNTYYGVLSDCNDLSVKEENYHNNYTKSYYRENGYGKISTSYGMFSSSLINNPTKFITKFNGVYGIFETSTNGYPVTTGYSIASSYNDLYCYMDCEYISIINYVSFCTC